MERTSEVLLDKLHYHKDVVYSAGEAINRVADLLDEVGMERLAGRLSSAVFEIFASVKALDGAYADDLTSRLKDSQALTASLLVATLEGCLVPKATKAKATTSQA